MESRPYATVSLHPPHRTASPTRQAPVVLFLVQRFLLILVECKKEAVNNCAAPINASKVLVKISTRLDSR